MGDKPAQTGELLDMIQTYGLESLGVYYSNYRGVITDTKDPEKLGRVKVRVHQVASDDVIETWAWPKGQPVGQDFGDFFVPPKGSPVWVEFENGDPQHPIWSGGHWAKENGTVPEEGQLDGAGNRVRKSEKWVVEMDDEGNKFKIKNKDGTDSFEITGDGKINVISANETKIETQNFNVEATGTGELKLGGVTLTYDGAGLTITAGGKTLKITGAGIEIEGKQFLTHIHTGVQPGPGNTGGVL